MRRFVVAAVIAMCFCGCYSEPQEGSYVSDMTSLGWKTGEIARQIYAREIEVNGKMYVVVQGNRGVAICQAVNQ